VVGLPIIGLVALDALSYVYHRIGISLGWMVIIMAAALLGSMINIPVARLRAEVRQESTTVTVFGVTYRVPVAIRTGSTTIAVNVGGAVVPTVVAIYLICHDRLPLNALFATLVVTALVFAVARPVAGVRDRHHVAGPAAGGRPGRDLAGPPFRRRGGLRGRHVRDPGGCRHSQHAAGPLAAGPDGIDRGRVLSMGFS